MTKAKKSLKKGEKVSWRSHGETVRGTVQEKITKRTATAGRTVAASAEEPQYRVRSDKTGRDAVHKPEALRHG
ncbi:DUF2945 domain-containing protein [Actinoplanes sichuanensis]|uniref:DUF2945 domain-containing protein n=1 Tax=Actinoplanes sichuanensis TaxID=512349 RepID=A0ABW4AC31_9ACTN|nr:DUF2945 domain-containing protein [Actinoplanes sichuanensis]BEL08947.1 DUF2945 domain-containing protein [Actinoplanes sichuanensis]